MINIVIFDDNAVRREGLKILINAMEDMNCISTFRDCKDIIQNLKALDVDVILMDINMPNVNGIEGLKLAKQAYPKIKIIMQTIFEDESRILEAISAGADGYIMKQKSPLSLIDGIKEVMDGGAPITPSVAGKILKLFNNRTISSPKSEVSLTKRETEILERFLINKLHESFMAIKKSELYSSLWKSCDELRGGMGEKDGHSILTPPD